MASSNSHGQARKPTTECYHEQEQRRGCVSAVPIATERRRTHLALASLTRILGRARSSLSLWLCSVNLLSFSSDIDCLCGREFMVVFYAGGGRTITGYGQRVRDGLCTGGTGTSGFVHAAGGARDRRDGRAEGNGDERGGRRRWEERRGKALAIRNGPAGRS